MICGSGLAAWKAFLARQSAGFCRTISAFFKHPCTGVQRREIGSFFRSPSAGRFRCRFGKVASPILVQLFESGPDASAGQGTVGEIAGRHFRAYRTNAPSRQSSVVSRRDRPGSPFSSSRLNRARSSEIVATSGRTVKNRGRIVCLYYLLLCCVLEISLTHLSRFLGGIGSDLTVKQLVFPFPGSRTRDSSTSASLRQRAIGTMATRPAEQPPCKWVRNCPQL